MSAIVEKNLYIGTFREKFSAGDDANLILKGGKMITGRIVGIGDEFIVMRVPTDEVFTVAVLDIIDFAAMPAEPQN